MRGEGGVGGQNAKNAERKYPNGHLKYPTSDLCHSDDHTVYKFSFLRRQLLLEGTVWFYTLLLFYKVLDLALKMRGGW